MCLADALGVKPLRYKVLATDTVSPTFDLERQWLAECDAELLVPENETAIPDLAPQADAVLNCYFKIGADLIKRLDACRIIARTGTGVDNVDMAAATARGILVTNVPDYCVDEVAEHALSLLLSLARRVPFMDRAVHAGTWGQAPHRPLYRIRGKVLGLVGLGNIGRALAQRARGIGLEVLAFDPFVTAEAASAAMTRKVDRLEDLLAQSHYVSIHAPLTKDTHHLIAARELGMMRRDAYLVNCSRGGLVDEAALAAAVTTGQIRGAALDVLEREAYDPSNPVFSCDGILITPHAAFYSEESLIELRQKAVDEIKRRLTGTPPRCPVNPEVLRAPQ